MHLHDLIAVRDQQSVSIPAVIVIPLVGHFHQYRPRTMVHGTLALDEVFYAPFLAICYCIKSDGSWLCQQYAFLTGQTVAASL